MSLYVKTSAGTSEHHIGSPLPRIFVNTIESIQADGDELLAIIGQFLNIPMASTRVVVWYGETAQFIYSNLRF